MEGDLFQKLDIKLIQKETENSYRKDFAGSCWCTGWEDASREHLTLGTTVSDYWVGAVWKAECCPVKKVSSDRCSGAKIEAKKNPAWDKAGELVLWLDP